MKSDEEWMSIKDILDLYANKMLVANPEYQRGVVWGAKQKKKLIDSVFRGYPLPLIYLHHIKKTVAGMQREDFEIIDGQQRITSLHEYVEGSFSLFDPVKDDAEANSLAFSRTSHALGVASTSRTFRRNFRPKSWIRSSSLPRSSQTMRTMFETCSSACKAVCPSTRRRLGTLGRASLRSTFWPSEESRKFRDFRATVFSKVQWGLIQRRIAEKRVSSRPR